MLTKYLIEWAKQKWGNKPREKALEEYQSALVTIFNSPMGEVILNQWLSDVYCTVSYVGTNRCCDVAFNDGHRAFVHELLETLHRIEAGRGAIKEEIEEGEYHA